MTAFFRSLGGSFGTAIFGAVLSSRLDYWLPRLVPAQAAARLHGQGTGLLGSPAAIHHLPALIEHGVLDSFVRSLHTVFWVGVPIGVLGFVLALFLREQKLRGPGAGAEEAAAISREVPQDDLDDLESSTV
jgi:predicted membrane protein